MNPLHYPDITRCKKLTEIGFPTTEESIRILPDDGYTFKEDFGVCPSVMEMLDVIPQNIDDEKSKESFNLVLAYMTGDVWSINYLNNMPHRLCPAIPTNTLPNALADLIFWLVENGYLKF